MAYLTGEWIRWFLLCALALLGIALVFSLLEGLEEVFPPGSESRLLQLWLWMGTYLPTVLPICCLLATLLTLAYLRKHGEWSAMLANGISPTRCFAMVFMLACLIGLIAAELVEKVAIDTETSEAGEFPLQMKIGSKRLWYFRSFDPRQMTGKELQLFCYGENGEDLMRIRANEATWSLSEGWKFKQASFLGFYSSKGLPVPDASGESIDWEDAPSSLVELLGKSPGINKSFDRLGGLGLDDDPTPFLLLRKTPKKMSKHQIDELIECLPEASDQALHPFRLRTAQLWWSGPSCLVAMLIGYCLGSVRDASSPGKIAGIFLLAALAFYLLRTLFDSMGENFVVGPMIAASMPYLIISLLGICYRYSKR